ncbi:hypothetical protein HF1_01580 [Mycoplasma haemofelis str. Langford 1]|uniref:Uncharacterized protein n=2 Tax=Mycoplasma haemofelis TaxID=29501 RepID=F6FG12_MYCHI|nr:hypothetical protein [Mycoplasma haemofelis]AEG72478.1 hypothetical protein MHF_0179 [Mycoplasma haemofelis Ohio2]CBY92166.1 hypothetical protein HF1_01580 [Mycoplasma haemofelis str. Langford 1]
MTSAAKIAAGLTGATGTAGLGVGGVYLSSKEDIFSKVKDDVLGTGEEFNPSWKSQFEKLSSENGKIPEDLKKLKSITEENKQISAIKGWCSESYKVTYKSSFSKGKEDLLRVVKKYCIQSIQEKITDAKLIDKKSNGKDTDFKSKYQELNSHKDTDGALDSTLKALKEGYSQDSSQSKWTELET